MHLFIITSYTLLRFLSLLLIYRIKNPSWKISGRKMVVITISYFLYFKMKLNQIHIWQFCVWAMVLRWPFRRISFLLKNHILFDHNSWYLSVHQNKHVHSSCKSILFVTVIKKRWNAQHTCMYHSSSRTHVSQIMRGMYKVNEKQEISNFLGELS